jgi:hypothetical protein
LTPSPVLSIFFGRVLKMSCSQVAQERPEAS